MKGHDPRMIYHTMRCSLVTSSSPVINKVQCSLLDGICVNLGFVNIRRNYIEFELTKTNAQRFYIG